MLIKKSKLFFTHQIRLIAVPGGKIERDMVSPGWGTKADILKHLSRTHIERPIQPKYKRCHREGEDCQVSNAGNVTL